MTIIQVHKDNLKRVKKEKQGYVIARESEEEGIYDVTIEQ